MHPRLLRDAPAGAFSLNLPWNRAIDQGRLYGVVQQQTWLHIGSPDALIAAERLLQSGAR
jgi:MurNAc alpha-1-phosphate uridylyltransferase